MTNSTAKLDARTSFDLNDILTAGEANTSLYDFSASSQEEPEYGLFERPRHTAPLRPRLAEIQHAANRSLFRHLGRVDSRGTAEPEAFRLTNEYRDNASRLESRIKEFLSYTEGWDGDNAEEIPMNAIYSSLNFLNELTLHHSGKEPRSAAPSPDGEVVFYWHGSQGYAEVNFDGTGSLTMCWGDETTDMEVIEEDDENITESSKGRVWTALSTFLQEKL